MDTNDAFQDQMPQTIGRYQVLGSIGFGAMGAVYKAFDPLIKRTLAIKTIRLDIPRSSPQYKSFIDRFYHEARISGTLSHPNIVTLFDIGEEGGLPYLAMEYVEGETIAGIIEKGQRFNPEKVIGLVSQIAAAVDYAHTKGVIHRDIKPSNLILYEGDKVKVTDFGIAKLIDAEMTQSGTLLGTPSYMSPEQAMGEKLDGRSDIFALGVCAFEMLSGEQPFPGNNVTSILYKLVHVDPIEPANLEMHGLVPEKWHQVFGKVLAKKPDDRYQTATEFVQDLEYCLGAWFGAAVGELTVAESPGAEGVGPDDATKARPVLQEDGPGATVALPPVPPGIKPTDTVPPTPLSAEEGTAHMEAVAQEAPPDEEGTVLMAAASQPEADEGTVLMRGPAAGSPEAEEGTVLMGAVSAVPPDEEEEGTFVMPSPALASAQEGTVLMPAPAAPAAESTVLMAAPAAPNAEGTVLMPRAATPPPQGAAPLTGPMPRPGAVDASQPPRGGPPLLLIVGGAALVGILVLIVGVVLLLRGHDQPAAPPTAEPVTLATATPAPTPASPTPAAPALGSMRVDSQPSGAAVSVNGEARGVTPVALADLPLGTYEVKLDLKGYEAAKQSVTLSAEAPEATVNLTLLRPVPVIGSIEILSVPPGALVSLNGAAAGPTPFRNKAVRPGVYRVQVTKEGYEPWVGDLTVQAGKKGKVEANLRPLPRATPTPPPKQDVVDPSKVYEPNEVDVQPKRTSGSTASYPNDAPKLRSGDAVSVAGSFVVTDTGAVTDVKVTESGGKALDEAVMAAVRGWKYVPGAKKGVKVKVRVPFRQTFRAG